MTPTNVCTAQKWLDVDVLELPKCGRAAIKGLRPSLTGDEPSLPCIVVPCELAEVLSTSWIQDVFVELSSKHQVAPAAFFIAICSEDSSIVYYKIGRGIIKPQV